MEDHLFVFTPGVWLGEGTIKFSYSQESFFYFTKWIVEEERKGVINCRQIVEVSSLAHQIENRFCIRQMQGAGFEIGLSNEFLSNVLGSGVVKKHQISWQFAHTDILEGKEEYSKLAEDRYLMHASYCAQNTFSTLVDGKIWLKSE